MLTNFTSFFKPPYNIHHIPAVLAVLGLFLFIPVVTLNLDQTETKKIEAASRPCPTIGNFGDVDDKVGITDNDAQEVLKFVAGSKVPNAQQKKNADVTGDRAITSLDAQAILLYVSGSPIQKTFKACLDNDGDNFSNVIEKYQKVDHLSPCGLNSWPPDFNNDQRVNTIDAGKFSGKIGAAATTEELKRLDLDGDGTITQAGDVTGVWSKYLNKTCEIVRYPAALQFLTFTGNGEVNPTVKSGSTVTLSWIGFGAPCTGEEGWPIAVVNSIGTYTTSKLSLSNNGKKYTLVCGSNHYEQSATVTITVVP